MEKQKRVGWITFQGLGGPPRLFEFDEALALGVLVILERAATLGRHTGAGRELDPTVHKPDALEALGREIAAGRLEARAQEPKKPCCYGLGVLHHDSQSGALCFTPCPTCGAHYAGDRAPRRPLLELERDDERAPA